MSQVQTGVKIMLKGSDHALMVFMDMIRANELVRKHLTGEFKLKGPAVIGEAFPNGDTRGSWSVVTDEIASIQTFQIEAPQPALQQTHTGQQPLSFIPGKSGI